MYYSIYGVNITDLWFLYHDLWIILSIRWRGRECIFMVSFPLILQLHFRLLQESNAGYDIRVTDRNMSLYNVQFVIGYYKNVYLHKLETKQHVLVKIHSSY